MRSLLPLPLLLLAIAALVLADNECTGTNDGRYYDLSPLISKKDYQVKAGNQTFHLNVCHAVVEAVWNPKDVRDVSKVGARFRMDHGDYSMGEFNSTLAYEHDSPVLIYSGGSPCSPDSKVRASTAIRFACDRDVVGAGEAELVAQLPPDSDTPCAFFFEWRTIVACPTSQGTSFWLVMKILSVTLLCIFLIYLSVGAAYRYYVLGLRGKKIIPQFWHSGLSGIVESFMNLFDRTPTRFVRLPDRNRTAGGRWSRGGGTSHYDAIDADEESEPLQGPDNPFTIDDETPSSNQAPPAPPKPTPSSNSNRNVILEP